MATSKIGGKRHLVPMIIKSFDLLEGFRERPDGLTYKELVERYPKISKVSIYRILCSLQAVGYLRKDPATNKFQLGAKFIELGRVTEKRQDLVRISRAYMDRLLKKFGENVNLAKIEGAELVYLSSLEGSHPLRVIEMPTRQQSLYCSAVGKAILAGLPTEERDDIISRTRFVKLTAHTITSKKRLLKELASIRERGYAVDNEENLLGVRCVGSAVYNGEAYPIGGISVTAPSSRLSEDRVEQVGQYVSSVALGLSAEQFGYRPDTDGE